MQTSSSIIGTPHNQIYHPILLIEKEHAMNCPEKIVGTYLRLNGFFLLPHFTVFDGESHTHVDFLAMRPPGGRERCGKEEFIIDEVFFECLNLTIQGDALNRLLGVVAEVKGGRIGKLPRGDHLNYAKNMFGPEAVLVQISFALDNKAIIVNGDAIAVSIEHAMNWVINRFNWMKNNLGRLSKEGSWTWSEVFLSDLLYLKKIGFVNAAD